MREGKKSFGVVTAAVTEKARARAMAAAWLLGVAGSPIRPAEPNTALFLLLLLLRAEQRIFSSQAVIHFWEHSFALGQRWLSEREFECNHRST